MCLVCYPILIFVGFLFFWFAILLFSFVLLFLFSNLFYVIKFFQLSTLVYILNFLASTLHFLLLKCEDRERKK